MDLGMSRGDSERMNYDNNFYREQSLENQNKKLRARVEELENWLKEDLEKNKSGMSYDFESRAKQLLEKDWK